MYPKILACRGGFNPRSHEGSDQKNMLKTSAKSMFQSTLPRGERLFGGSGSTLIACVSIHAPTRGATVQPPNCSGRDRVSIHAPTRGATGRVDMHYKDLSVSIHAPTRGATICHIVVRHLIICFNPRSHEGSDCPGRLQCTVVRCFNPRSHEGSDSNFSQN